jgi:four helix bundle protein
MSEIIRPDISVYNHAITVAREVFSLTCKLPVQQRFVLTSQLRRSIILVCNRLSAVAYSETKAEIKRNSELFIRVYAEIKTQIKMTQTLGHFKPAELMTLEDCLDGILQYCKNNLGYNRN